LGLWCSIAFDISPNKYSFEFYANQLGYDFDDKELYKSEGKPRVKTEIR
jgi:hypothetical protein